MTLPNIGTNELERILKDLQTRVGGLETRAGIQIVARTTIEFTPQQTSVPNDGVTRTVYTSGGLNVPSGARMLNVIYDVQGRHTTNASAVWSLHIRNSDGTNYTQLDTLRQHNNNDQFINMGGTLMGWHFVGDYGATQFVLTVNCANDPGSGSWLGTVYGKYSCTFFK